MSQPLSLPSHRLSEASSFPHAVRFWVKTSEERWPTDASHVKMATLLGQQDLVPQHKTGLFFPSAPIPLCLVHGQRLAGICTHGRGGRQAAAVDICPAVHGSLASAACCCPTPYAVLTPAKECAGLSRRRHYRHWSSRKEPVECLSVGKELSPYYLCFNPEIIS